MGTDSISEVLGSAKEMILQLKADVAILQLRLALKKFDPNQPRWPKGVHEGGQWKPVGGTLVAQQEGIYDPSRMPMCLAQMEADEELCRMAKSSRCWESSQIRYNNCMKNVYIPRLEVGR
ncbi:MAG: hypothetical protein HY834_01280 [Devosia nanyangense]|uniref:Uncharacterized protein n=1 Tax=Devosia nanyangense TaxID=1228055 RepID=A0A933KYU3_9HYPH|nr:hypothetical protein [Devosia nanyangense]